MRGHLGAPSASHRHRLPTRRSPSAEQPGVVLTCASGRDPGRPHSRCRAGPPTLAHQSLATRWVRPGALAAALAVMPVRLSGAQPDVRLRPAGPSPSCAATCSGRPAQLIRHARGVTGSLGPPAHAPAGTLARLRALPPPVCEEKPPRSYDRRAQGSPDARPGTEACPAPAAPGTPHTITGSGTVHHCPVGELGRISR